MKGIEFVYLNIKLKSAQIFIFYLKICILIWKNLNTYRLSHPHRTIDRVYTHFLPKPNTFRTLTACCPPERHNITQIDREPRFGVSESFCICALEEVQCWCIYGCRAAAAAKLLAPEDDTLDEKRCWNMRNTYSYTSTTIPFYLHNAKASATDHSLLSTKTMRG